MKQKGAELLFILIFIKELLCQNQYFRVRPSDREVVVGENVEFRCHVGNREGNVQWSKDGFLLGFDPKIPGYPRYFMEVEEEKGIYNLRLLNVGVQDEGEYQCQVGPAFNHTPIRATAHLRILIAPTHISINDSDENNAVVEVKQNTPVRLKCETLGSRPASRLKWYINNTEVSTDSVQTQAKEERGKFVTSSYFAIRPKIEDNNSRLGCEAFHKALDRKLKAQVILSVLHPPAIPRILGYEEGTIVKAGDALSLLCMTEGGNPLPELIWYRGNAQIDASYYTLPGRKTANNLTLTITSTDNGGSYHCQASNAATRDPQTTTIKLSVYHLASKLGIVGPQEAARGETITLSCTTDVSNPKSLIAWSVDGEMVEGGQEVEATKSSSGWITTSNLTITLTRQEPDVKEFTCTARNPHVEGSVNVTHKLRVSYPPNTPTILGFDATAALRIGDIQRFNCVALGGNPPATLKWFKGDREISAPMRTTGSGVSSELLIRVQLNDNGATYRCEAHNPALKKPMAAHVRLAVHFPPAFVNISYSPPEPRNGDNVTVTCTSGSSNPLSRISWKKDSSFLRDHREETLGSVYGGIATRSRLSFIAKSSDDGSLFTCQARSDVFKSPISQSVTIRIRHKPRFSSTHQVVDVEEKKFLILNLTADAYPEKVAYVWFRNSEKIPSGNSRISASGPMFYVKNASREDAGVYYCTAENDEGTSNASVVLNVLYGVSIVNLSRSDSDGPLVEGKEASFHCEADGNPVKSDMIEWRLKGTAVREGRPTSLEGGRRSILKISNVSRDHRGALECIGDNGIGGPSMLAILLNVLYRPVVVRSVGLTVGNLGRLSCTVDGPGDMSVTWRFNGTTIHPLGSNKYQVTFTRRDDYEWISMLTISNVSSTDYGAYTCSATNSLGQNNAEIILGDKSVHEVAETTTAPSSKDFTSRFYNPRFWWIPAAAIGIIIVLLSCVIILCCMRKKSNRTAHEDCRRARHIDLSDLTADEVCNKLLLSADVKSLLLCAAEKQRIPMQDFKEHSVFTIEDAFNIDIMSGRNLSGNNKDSDAKRNGEDGVKETLLAEVPHTLEKPKDDRPDILRNEKSASLATIKEVPDSCSTPASGSPESPRYASTPSGSTGSCLSVYHEKVPLRSLGADIENPDLMKLHPIMVLGMVDDSLKFKES